MSRNVSSPPTYFLISKLNVARKIVNVMEKIFPSAYVQGWNKRHQQIFPKRLAGVVLLILQFVKISALVEGTGFLSLLVTLRIKSAPNGC